MCEIQYNQYKERSLLFIVHLCLRQFHKYGFQVYTSGLFDWLVIQHQVQNLFFHLMEQGEVEKQMK